MATLTDEREALLRREQEKTQEENEGLRQEREQLRQENEDLKRHLQNLHHKHGEAALQLVQVPLSCAMLWCAVPCCAVPCRAVLCCLGQTLNPVLGCTYSSRHK